MRNFSEEFYRKRALLIRVSDKNGHQLESIGFIFRSFFLNFAPISIFGRTYPLYGNHLQDLEASHDIERCLAAPVIELVFGDSWKPGSVGTIGKMTQPKILLNNVSDFGDFLVFIDLRGGPHCLDSLMGMISSESVACFFKKHQAASANG